MSRYVFLVTSAINTKFGVYDSVDRLKQTLNTVASIRRRAPGHKVIVLEMAALPLTAEQRTKLTEAADNLIEFSSDPSVVGLYNSTDNWDVVKNVTEMMCFQNALKKLHDTGVLAQHQRAFKVSGRYELTDNFDPAFYDAYASENMIVVAASRASQFPLQITGGIARQYMSRLWSWPTTLTPEIIAMYSQGLEYIYQRLAVGGYADIEHVLYQFLDHDKVLEKETVGLRGNIGPNGAAVED